MNTGRWTVPLLFALFVLQSVLLLVLVADRFTPIARAQTEPSVQHVVLYGNYCPPHTSMCYLRKLRVSDEGVLWVTK